MSAVRPRLDSLLRTLFCTALAGAFGAVPVLAQPRDSTVAYVHERAPVAQAARLEGSIRVDGVLEEAAWAVATPVTEFTQTDPEEGRPASERTEVRILVGDDALYIGARLFDRDPAKIKARLSRRDDPVETDAFDVWIDSYHDHLTARHFRVNPAGAILDASVGADGGEDESWDPVWEAAARVDSAGWSAELRIPLSQLRYNAQQSPTWGLQLARTIFRRGESALFSFTPKKERGGVSRYGHLTGLGQLARPRRLEIIPYVSSRNEHLDIPPGDPFRSRNDFFGATGGDLKYGLTSDLTLDLTVNPDFGQVEVDPAEVNLTAFETFFPERRPFFIEGADLFAFGRSGAFNNFSVPTIFNSRRIGRSPQRILRGPNFGSVNAPPQTTIAGAAKVTGHTSKGWSVGVLDAVTTREDADFVDTLGVERQAAVEPLTHYFTGRVRRELRAGNTSIGALATAVNRDLGDPALAGLLRSDAYLGGLDLNHAWQNRRWALDAALTGSRVQGTPAAIAATQGSSARYLQRPDHADYFTFDPTRTRLDGYGFDGSISKTSGAHWLGSLAYVSRSPGYEANDLGFGTRADYRGFSSIVLFQQNKPGRVFRNYTMFPYANEMWNFGGDRVYDSYAFDVNGTFVNFYNFDFRTTLNRSAMDDRLTRGGPQARSPELGSWSANLGSDSRKSYNVNVNFQHSWNEFGGYGDFPSLSLSFRPSPTLRLRFEPSYSASHALGQSVTAVPDVDATATYGTRYVFSTLDQRVMSLVTRCDWTMRPRLSLQVYLQPLVVTGHYSQFKEFAAPEEFRFEIYGQDRGTITRSLSGVYTIDPGNGATFRLNDPDFNFRSLLGNAVLRWEYRPGSTLFVVWQQRRTDVVPVGDFDFSRDYSALLDHAPENVFAVKATYWIGL